MEICKKCSSYDPDGKLARRTWVRGIASDYTYDAAGRRTAIAKSGSAFGDLSGSIDSYTYNARSELISARRTKNGQPIPGFSEDFDYDPIGNRRSSATYNEKGEAQTSTYEANSLNQYTSRTTPGYAAVRGEADPNATVTVNENPTFRLGSYYFGSDLFDNTSAGGLANLETYATLLQTAANGNEADDLVSTETNQVYIAQSPETFAYDDDGNQTQVATKTGLWRVTYNGENRPVRWVRDSDNTTLVMSYDHMGRRREKNAQRFFYDGYLQVADNVGNSYAWDCTEPIATRPLSWRRDDFFGYYAHDGNKNVSEVMSTDGIIAAHYEYAPFGAVTTQRGESTTANPWRFSSEYADDDTATVYYNYRHYQPVVGRWLWRDPIGELVSGGLFLVSHNSLITSIDVLGLTDYGKICRDAIGKVWNKKESALKKWFKANAPKGCPMPGVVCGCCDKGSNGFMPGGSTKHTSHGHSTIKICQNEANGNEAAIEETLKHELFHAIDYCETKRTFTCEEEICSEIKAYSGADCANLSGDLKKECVKKGAKRSSKGFAPCKGRNVDQMVDDAVDNGTCK